jgi:hypothetical protein
MLIPELEALSENHRKQVETAVVSMVSDFEAMSDNPNSAWFSPKYHFFAIRGPAKAKQPPIVLTDSKTSSVAYLVISIASSLGACKIATAEEGKISEMVNLMIRQNAKIYTDVLPNKLFKKK